MLIVKFYNKRNQACFDIQAHAPLDVTSSIKNHSSFLIEKVSNANTFYLNTEKVFRYSVMTSYELSKIKLFSTFT